MIAQKNTSPGGGACVFYLSAFPFVISSESHLSCAPTERQLLIGVYKNPHFRLSVISKDKADDVLSENDGYGQYFQEKNKKY